MQSYPHFIHILHKVIHISRSDLASIYERSIDFSILLSYNVLGGDILKEFILANPIAFASIIVCVIACIITFLVILCDTKSVKKSIKAVKEVIMAFRMPNYRSEQVAEEKEQTAQQFSPLIDEYEYIADTNEIEKTGKKINVDEKIQSYLSTRFEEMLEKFLNPVRQERNDIIASPDEMSGDLESMLNAYDGYVNRAEELREKYKLPQSLATADVYQAVQGMYEKQKSYVETLARTAKPEIKTAKPEIKEDEK